MAGAFAFMRIATPECWQSLRIAAIVGLLQQFFFQIRFQAFDCSSLCARSAGLRALQIEFKINEKCAEQDDCKANTSVHSA